MSRRLLVVGRGGWGGRIARTLVTKEGWPGMLLAKVGQAGSLSRAPKKQHSLNSLDENERDQNFDQLSFTQRIYFDASLRQDKCTSFYKRKAENLESKSENREQPIFAIKGQVPRLSTSIELSASRRQDGSNRQNQTSAII